MVAINRRHAGRVKRPTAIAVPPTISDSMAIRAWIGAKGMFMLSSHSTKPFMSPVPTRPALPSPCTTKQVPMKIRMIKMPRSVSAGLVSVRSEPRSMGLCSPVVLKFRRGFFDVAGRQMAEPIKV